MRSLSSSLTAAQKSASRIPAVSVRARNLSGGIVSLVWTRLYTGEEPDGPHALTLPGDGSLIRLRVTPPADVQKLYFQRVTNPGPASDFSQWTYLNQYSVTAAAACSKGAEVSLCWAKTDGRIYYMKSLNNGADWQAVENPGTAPAAAVAQMAAAYKTNGDLAVFFADASTLYVIKRVGGVWQSRVAWDKSTGSLSGAAAVYDGDWKLLVSGRDTGGSFKLWSLVYGDGYEAAAGTWSALKELASAPADGGYEFKTVFMDKPDSCRCFFVEKYTAAEAAHRPFWSHTLPGTSFLDNRWREPVPFEQESECGLALARPASPWLSYEWLSSPSGVWRSSLYAGILDLSGDVISLKQDLSPDNGQISIELRNDAGQYNLPGQGNLALLERGCRIDFSPGYITAAGSEYSTGQSFILQGYEHVCSPGKAGLILYASDGWEALEKWTARYQFRWNKDGDEASVKEILTQVLARSGIKLEVKSASSVVTGFYPDFTLHPGDRGREAVRRLLSFVPDVLFLEGNKAYLVNPLAGDEAEYDYGTGHVIFEGRYHAGSWKYNRVRVEGEGVITEDFDWPEIRKRGDILEMVEDLNIDTGAGGHDRGAACLRKAEMESVSGLVRVPVNCAQQLYDVIALTDSRAGLAAAKRRVLGIRLDYRPDKGEYEQKLLLGGL